MSRKNSPSDMHLQVGVTVLCPRNNEHAVGEVYRLLPPHPNAGAIRVGNGLKLIEGPNNARKVEGRCRVCNSQARVSWDRIASTLADLQASGEHHSKITPQSTAP